MYNALNCDGDGYNGELTTLFFTLCLLLRLWASHFGLIGYLLCDLVDRFVKEFAISVLCFIAYLHDCLP